MTSSGFQPVFLFLHIAGVLIWVGGMFFAYICLRPVAAALLDPPLRLPLWGQVFSRFFPWVWGAILALLLSGLGMFAGSRSHSSVHVMMGIGLVMMAIFSYVYFDPFRRLKAGIAAADWKTAATALNTIRQLVALNLSLGLITVAVATLGRYFA